MRRYETMVIIDPEIPEQDRSGLFDRLGELITGQSGYLVECDEWGTRKLAYEIKKKPRGYYARLDFCGSGELVRELERNFRIDDRFLKYMTVLLDEDADVEALKEEAARKKAEKAAEQEAASAESETQPASEAPATAEPAPEPEAEAEPEPETEPEPDAPAPGGESEAKEGA
ncbi:MAG: 30S ribosomal protein S6 [Desulfobacterales bacterium]